MTATTGTITPEQKQEILARMRKEVKKLRNYSPRVGVFGGTGAGKSSLCNALFGREVAKISDVEACTREPQEIFIPGEDGQGPGMTLIDVPGIGEDPERHEEYIQLYKSLTPELDLILWAIKADDRGYSPAISAYRELRASFPEMAPVIFVITQVDKLDPIREWRDATATQLGGPGEKQQANILAKIADVSARFDISARHIVAVSSHESYNLRELVERIVEVVPDQKKYAFVREAVKDNVSEEAEVQAEKGFWQYIADQMGSAFIYARDYLAEKIPDLISNNKEAIMTVILNFVKNMVAKK